ncbi:MAG: hypothetical protein JST79_07095 [Acidobacteria bacterium]|nr:hypothetical protein [Acidobacteriota bacterium]
MKRHLQALILTLCMPTLSLMGQQPTILGKTNIHALLEAAPGVPRSTAEAADRWKQSDAIYQPFQQKVEAAHKQLQESMAARAHQAPDAATMEKQAKAMSNANPIVSGMGGVDKIQQMTPEQREAAARQSAANYQQSLVTGNGRNSPAMQAMMQKMMTDPAYRARFMQMSEAEKEAELRKNMGPVAPQSVEDHQKGQQELKAADEIRNSQAIQQDLQKMTQRIQSIETEFAKKDQAISDAPGNHAQIGRDIGAKIAKVPVVELGEYGHDKDPAQMQALYREQATRDRERAAAELTQRAALYEQKKSQYKEVVSAYQEWLKQNQARINPSMNDLLKGTNTELAVAGFEQGLIGLAEDLAKYSKHATQDAAGYEQNYQEKIPAGH